MQDAAVKRLSDIISKRSDGGSDNNNSAHPRRPVLRLHIGLAEGWFSLFLLAVVVYSTIWCVQAVGWVDHLSILTLTTALGLIIGVIAAKQQRIPRFYMHLIAIAAGLMLAFWQTAGADYAGNVGAFANGIHQWFLNSLAGGSSQDDSIFLFFITALGFVLAYTSAWLVYRTRIPWLMIVANAIVLLINLSNTTAGYVIFLVVFVLASLLLVLRFNLYESIRRWRRQGLRYADDLGWDVMQAGAMISIGILIVSWILPWGYINDTASQIWNVDSNPWIELENTWDRIVSISGGADLSSHGNFRDTLILGGNPNLNDDIVFTVQSDDGTQYLESLSYNTYDGRDWTNGKTYNLPLRAHDTTTPESLYVHVIKQNVNVVNPPGEQYPYLPGASQVASTDQPSTVLLSAASNSQIAVLGTQGKIVAGDQYNISSYVSSADIKTLRSIPFPSDAPQYPPNYDGSYPVEYYSPSILNTYLQVLKNLDPNILMKAKQVTSDATNMYDKAVALEEYLRTFTYDVNIRLPQGEEGVSWFLFRSGQRGFCNYFATAMAIMARELGMPARIVSGYTNGQYDVAHHRWIIRGKDAHTWTQIYFAGYGWINFEPSANFTTFSRPLPAKNGVTLPLPTSTSGSSKTTSKKLHDVADPSSNTSSATSATSAAAQAQQLRQEAGFVSGGVVMLVLIAILLFIIWWRRLFKGYGIPAQIYGRICLLANWAGIDIQRSQTPYEYIHTLTEVTPAQAAALERFGDIYVRELWADPDSKDHPRHTGEIKELPDIWKQLRPGFFFYVLRHPYFLRKLPAYPAKILRRLKMHRHNRQFFD